MGSISIQAGLASTIATPTAAASDGGDGGGTLGGGGGASGSSSFSPSTSSTSVSTSSTTQPPQLVDASLAISTRSEGTNASARSGLADDPSKKNTQLLTIATNPPSTSVSTSSATQQPQLVDASLAISTRSEGTNASARSGLAVNPSKKNTQLLTIATNPPKRSPKTATPRSTKGSAFECWRPGNERASEEGFEVGVGRGGRQSDQVQGCISPKWSGSEAGSPNPNPVHLLFLPTTMHL